MAFRTLNKALAVAAFTLAVPIAGGASAATVFYDDFDGEGGSATRLNYDAFANFDVSGGKVDLISLGNLHRLAGDGSYVDLDGTKSGGGILTTKQSFDFAAGDLITLSFEVSGNQRSAAKGSDDELLAGFTFGGATLIRNYTLGGNFGFSNLGDSSASHTSNSALTAWNAPFGIYTVSFLAGSAGSLKAFVGTSSNDNVGPLLDKMKLTITSGVPEPATWAMMIVGFGLVGSAVRRRNRQVSPA